MRLLLMSVHISVRARVCAVFVSLFVCLLIHFPSVFVRISARMRLSVHVQTRVAGAEYLHGKPSQQERHRVAPIGSQDGGGGAEEMAREANRGGRGGEGREGRCHGRSLADGRG